MSFYADKENLRGSLRHFLAIFSEGKEPMVPILRDHAATGEIMVKETLSLPCYEAFPDKKQWLEIHAAAEPEVVAEPAVVEPEASSPPQS